MEIVLSSRLRDRLLAIAASSPSAEVCGLLTGPAADRITGIIPAANVAPDPSRAFELDPATLFATIRAARAGGDAVLGHYHSHPGGDARPSRRDAEAAGQPGLLWLILGRDVGLWRAVQGGPVLGAFAPATLVIADAIARSAASRHKSVDLGRSRG